MANVSKEDFDRLHDKVDKNGESLARIEGILNERRETKKNGLTLAGLISALLLGIWNLIK